MQECLLIISINWCLVTGYNYVKEWNSRLGVGRVVFGLCFCNMVLFVSVCAAIIMLRKRDLFCSVSLPASAVGWTVFGL